MSDRSGLHNLEAEQALLSAVLLQADAWADAATVLSASDFFRSAHGRIWEAVERLRANRVAVDLVTVKDELGRSGELDAVGGPAYLASLLDGASRSTNVAHYAGIVREKARLRAVAQAAEALLESACLAQEQAGSIVENGLQSLLAAVGTTIGGAVGVGPGAVAYVASLDDPTAGVAVPTGYRDIDETLAGGIRRQEMAIVAARPSVGKTAFALGIARAAAAAGTPSAVFSLEMSTEALMARMIGAESKIGMSRLRAKALVERDYDRLGAAVAVFHDIPMVLIDSAYTLAQIAAWCDRLRQREEGLGLIVIDYIQKLIVEADNRSGAMSVLSGRLKQLAKQQDVPLVALSQLSRAPEDRRDKRPQLSDLRESGALEQDADIAMLLFREEMHAATEENRGIAECIIAKQRNGPTGVRRLYFNSECAWFGNLAVEY